MFQNVPITRSLQKREELKFKTYQVAEYSSSVNDDYCDIVKIAQKEYEQARAENIARELS
jgi:hypothetical protein